MLCFCKLLAILGAQWYVLSRMELSLEDLIGDLGWRLGFELGTKFKERILHQFKFLCKEEHYWLLGSLEGQCKMSQYLYTNLTVESLSCKSAACHTPQNTLQPPEHKFQIKYKTIFQLMLLASKINGFEKQIQSFSFVMSCSICYSQNWN